jgi:hypothetical protein
LTLLNGATSRRRQGAVCAYDLEFLDRSANNNGPIAVNSNGVQPFIGEQRPGFAAHQHNVDFGYFGFGRLEHAFEGV